MADFNWTEAQRQAINSRGNILVSAAAGSGKTATLASKILNLLSDSETSLSQFLIVTFTKAAAGEMRERISRELSKAALENKALSRHMRDIASADICTIHSFCTKILRENFTSLGLSPDFSVCDESVSAVMKARAMEDTVDDFFRGRCEFKTGGSADIFTLADTVGKTRDAASLDLSLRELYDKLVSMGLDEDYLRLCAEKLEEGTKTDFLLTPWGEEIVKTAACAAEYYLGILEDLKSEMAQSDTVTEKYMPAAVSLTDYLGRILSASKGASYAKMQSAVSDYEPVSLGSLSAKYKTDASEAFKTLRDEIKKLFARLANKYFAVPERDIAESMTQLAAVLKGCADVLEVYGKRYASLKRERGVLDFADLELYALRLLTNADGTPTAAALEIGKRYKYVFIDEYQDTNRVQDRIFRAVSSEAEKFFVGDIKQSIYRFRGAEPEVFSGYRNAWREDGLPSGVEGYPEGRSIFMSENFRCAEPIVKFVNAVSRHMFPYGGIPFTDSDCLVYGGVSKCDAPVEVCLLDGSRRKNKDEETLSEADYVAGRIAELIRNGEYKPADIAILLRSANTSGGEFERALASRGIPVNRAGGSPFADAPEVILMLDILRAVDNPMHDIPLMGAMMSSVFGFTMDELVRLRHADTDCPLYSAVERAADGTGAIAEKCAEFVKKLNSLRNSERGMSADSFIDHVIAECSLYDCAEVTSSVCGKDNVRRIRDLASTYESGVFGGLYGFLSFLDEKLDSGELTVESAEAGSGVTIISIHKSKGLEYKVCFLAQCGKQRNTADEKGGILFHRELGLAMRLPDPGGLVMCGNPVRDALALKIGEDSAMEEMRVLYVAMTRAVERLYVTAKCSKAPAEELQLAEQSLPYEGQYSVRSRPRMIDHILSAVVKDASLPVKITLVSRDAGTGETTEIPLDLKEESIAEAEETEIKAIAENAAFKYPYLHMTTLPSKLSVSSLYPEILDGSADEGTRDAHLSDLLPDTSYDAEEVPDEPELAMPLPRFMSESITEDAAQRGTSTHVFLQFASFEAIRDSGAAGEIRRLSAAGFLTEKMASLVDVRQVEHFAASGIVERILHSRNVYREFRFNLPLPAADFTSDEALRELYERDSADITVQGVFDCIFEDAEGKLVLLDYKTDAMSAYEMRNHEAGHEKLRRRHSRQLYYYKVAAERIFGRTPDEVYIYSLTLGEEVPLKF